MKIGVQAINYSGIQNTLAVQLAEQSKTTGAIALRAPENPIQRYNELASPKTMAIKEKTTNWGPMQGHIPVDEAFTRVDKNGRSLGHKAHGFALAEVHTVQEQVSLHSLLAHVENHEYALTDYDSETGQLTFTVTPRSQYRNKAFMGNFCIFLFEGLGNTVPENQRYTRPIDAPHSEETSAFLKQLSETAAPWNEKEFGPIAATLNKRYPLYSLNDAPHNSLPEPVLIYADGRKRPFTSDWDTLWIGIPKKSFTPKVLSLASLEINAQTPEAIQYLNLSEKQLLDYLSTALSSARDNPALKESLNANTSAKGIINLWEYFHLLLNNSQYRDPYIQDVFQHGPETRNPFTPESLNNPCLHFVNGDIILTEREEELLDLVQNRGYFADQSYVFAQENVLHVHPSWLDHKYSQYPERWAEVQKQQEALLDSLSTTPTIKETITLMQPTPTSTVAPIAMPPDPVVIPVDRFHVPKNLDFKKINHGQHVLAILQTNELHHLEQSLRLRLAKMQEK